MKENFYNSTNKYKRYTLYTLIVTVAAIVIALASSSIKKEFNNEKVVNADVTKTNSNYTLNENSSQETDEASEILSKDVYLITVYEGNIAVFRNDEKEPYLLSVSTEHLTEEDLKLLKNGIKADSISEVMEILEDYE